MSFSLGRVSVPTAITLSDLRQRSLFFPVRFLRRHRPRLSSNVVRFLIVKEARKLSFKSKGRLSRVFFPFKEWEDRAVGLLVLRSPGSSSAMSFLNPVGFVNVKEDPIG